MPLEHIVVDVPDGALYADSCLDGFCHGEAVDTCDDPTDPCNEVVWGEVVDEDYAYIQLLPLYRDADGAWRLITPIHPETPMEGGVVRLRLADEYGACEAVEFEIEPLVPAPGTLRALVDGLRAYAEAKAQLLGYTLEEIWALPIENVPEYLLPLWVLYDSFDPEQDTSLESMARGTSSVFRDNPEGRELFEALLARSDVEGFFAERVERMQTLRGRAFVGFNTVGSTGIRTCVDFSNIETAEQLNSCMEIARWLGYSLSDDSTSTRLYNDLNTTAAVGGMSSNPVINWASFGAAGTLWAARHTHRAIHGELPSELEALDVEVDEAWDHEDDPSSRSWRARLRARSKGWSYGTIPAEAVGQLAFSPRSPSVTGLVSKALRVPPSSGNLARARNFSVPSQKTIEARKATGESVSSLIDGLIGVKGGELLSQADLGEDFSREPKLTGWVDVSEDTWTQRQSVRGLIQFKPHGSTSVEEERHSEFWIRSGGVETLAVRTQPLKEQTGELLFGGDSIAGTVDFSIPSIQTEVTLANVTVTADNEEITFLVDVYNALTPVIDVSASLGTIDSVESVGPNQWRIAYTGPTVDELAEEDDQIVVDVSSTQGVFTEAVPPARQGHAVVSIRPKIDVTPGLGCLKAGQTEQFEATVKGLEDQGVTWWASAGSIDSNGRFVAPEGEHYEIEVTATSTAAPNVSRTVIIAANVCECWYAMSWGGLTERAQPGDELSRAINWYPYFPTQGSYFWITFGSSQLFFIPGLNVGYTGMAGPFDDGANFFTHYFDTGDEPWRVSMHKTVPGGAPVFEFDANTRDILSGRLVPEMRRGFQTVSGTLAESRVNFATLEFEFSIASDAGPRPEYGLNSYSCVVGE